MAAEPKRITVIESDGSDSSDDDAPPPLEDMSESLSFRKKYTHRKAAVPTKRSKAEGATRAAAAAPPVDRGEYASYTNVELYGLSTVKYNGCSGVVKGYDPETKRHQVKLDKGGKILKVKPANLKKVDTFSGLGKGFFARDGSGAKAGSDGGEPDEDIETIKPRNPGERPGQFSEVQEAMAQAAPFLEQRKDEWCTPQLLEKIEAVPGMAAMMQNPLFATALEEFQQNPAAAMKKYGSNQQVAKFFQTFMGVMGSHLSELGEKEETANAAAQSRDPEAMAAISKPGVKEALQDPRIQKMIEQLQQHPEQGAQILAAARRFPEVAQKLKTLVDAGVLGMAR